MGSKYETSEFAWCGERLDLRGDLWAMGTNQMNIQLTKNMYEAMMNSVCSTSDIYEIKRVGDKDKFVRKRWYGKYWWQPKFDSIIRRHGYNV